MGKQSAEGVVKNITLSLRGAQRRGNLNLPHHSIDEFTCLALACPDTSAAAAEAAIEIEVIIKTPRETRG